MRVNDSERSEMRRLGYLSAPEAAELARIHVSSVYRAVKRGDVGSRRVRHTWYVDARGWSMLWAAMPERAAEILAAVKTP